MEDLYKILHCSPSALGSELKKAYQELALKHHPDKAKAKSAKSPTSQAASSEKFIKIHRAYKILSDSVLREQYDVKWQERCLAQTYPIQDTVDFEDFEEISDTSCNEPLDHVSCEGAENSEKSSNLKLSEDSKSDFEESEQTKGSNACSASEIDDEELSSHMFIYPCRCGGNYTLTDIDVKLNVDIVCCDTCSLTIEVVYNSETDDSDSAD